MRPIYIGAGRVYGLYGSYPRDCDPLTSWWASYSVATGIIGVLVRAIDAGKTFVYLDLTQVRVLPASW